MSSKAVLTPRELECLSHVLLSAKDLSGFQVDFEKMGELAGVAPKSASNMWGVIKKKLISAATSNAEDSPSTPGTAPKTKAAPKKRAPAKGKGTAAAGAEVEGDNGVAADDEQTPTNTPKKKAGVKRKIKAENSDDGNEDCAANGEDGTDEAPAKKKRVYNRKPKDTNATTAKPRAKKGAKGASFTAVNNDDDDDDVANNQLLNDANSEDGADHQTMFRDGDIKVEGPDELDEFEQYEVQKAIDEQTFGAYA